MMEQVTLFMFTMQYNNFNATKIRIFESYFKKYIFLLTKYYSFSLNQRYW